MSATKDNRLKVSLVEFPEYDPGSYINSPRSLRACKSEGVLPTDLVYKSLEQFSEKNLSPRLVKLRYDFFEAKRRDLLSTTRRARELMIAEEKRAENAGSNALQTISKQSGLSMGALMALNSEGLKLEREKLARAQAHERNWLKNTLNNELAQLQKLESASKKMAAEDKGNEEQMKEMARKTKEMNDRRREEEDRKAREMEAQSKLEKQIALEEFMKQQAEMHKQQEREQRKRVEQHERALADMERKRQAEVEKEEKKEREFQKQQQRIEELRAQDMKRQEIQGRQKQNFQLMMQEKQEARDLRIYQSLENNMELERQKRREYEERLAREQMREEKMATQRALQQEAGAKKSFQLMMRRKCIQDEAARKMEDRRMAIMESQEETECRLLDHEQKKERYLDFKRELDGLKDQNKFINVQRQRRREEHKRQEIAEAVIKKDEKIDMLSQERDRLWDTRRATQVEAQRAREAVKNQIMAQRIASKYNSKKVEQQLHGIMKMDIFSPNAIQTSASSPSLVQSSAAQVA